MRNFIACVDQNLIFEFNLKMLGFNPRHFVRKNHLGIIKDVILPLSQNPSKKNCKQRTPIIRKITIDLTVKVSPNSPSIKTEIRKSGDSILGHKFFQTSLATSHP